MIVGESYPGVARFVGLTPPTKGHRCFISKQRSLFSHHFGSGSAPSGVTASRKGHSRQEAQWTQNKYSFGSKSEATFSKTPTLRIIMRTCLEQEINSSRRDQDSPHRGQAVGSLDSVSILNRAHSRAFASVGREMNRQWTSILPIRSTHFRRNSDRQLETDCFADCCFLD